MNRIVFATAFLLGAIAVIWMGSSFIGSNALALTVTVIIGCVYTIGFIELLQYRQATATLTQALGAVPDNPAPGGTVLEDWLAKLHPSLQNAVRLRIEGERVGLPAPAITPYLVGLLVMLGLLGTFVGMVETLGGAVVALEGTTELQAIRAGLAAPIEGLSLAFGTSVAGVAASAMLGLISTLSRRDRMLETRLLDSKIATVFRDFSLTHNRQETYKALQLQAQALPEVATRMQAMADQLERMGDTLGDKLLANQAAFHTSMQTIYTELATSVGTVPARQPGRQRSPGRREHQTAGTGGDGCHQQRGPARPPADEPNRATATRGSQRAVCQCQHCHAGSLRPDLFCRDRTAGSGR